MIEFGVRGYILSWPDGPFVTWYFLNAKFVFICRFDEICSGNSSRNSTKGNWRRKWVVQYSKLSQRYFVLWWIWKSLFLEALLGTSIWILCFVPHCIFEHFLNFLWLNSCIFSFRHSGTPAVMCAHKQASGFLYPLEKGFVYVHKPPMYIRFEEVCTIFTVWTSLFFYLEAWWTKWGIFAKDEELIFSVKIFFNGPVVQFEGLYSC